MKKTFQQVLFGFVFSLLICSLGIIHTPVAVQAKTTNATTNEKKKSKKLCNEFTNFLGMQLTEGDPSLAISVGKSTTWIFETWKKEDLTYRYNLVVPLQYMSDEGAAERVFGLKDFYVSPVIGDWGEAFPELSLKSATKKSTSKYTAVCDIKWVNSMDNTTKKIGTATFTLKKKKGTHYGFIVKSIKIKKVANF